ncbi:MAG TPA: helix-turn-helix transcriptional regulator [Polyangiaceae bacterium]|nr:helix-turn-helix transcriptional regulator [Polyangiaceae bacterium]
MLTSEEPGGRGRPRVPSSALTPAERVIVELIANGLSNRVVADARGCTPRTVANQLTVVYRKLGISSRRELRALLTPEPASERVLDSLTPRERQVLSLADFGRSNKAIAHALGLSISTVSTTLTRARRKLAAIDSA